MDLLIIDINMPGINDANWRRGFNNPQVDPAIGPKAEL
jgi:hypothetical protein